MTRLQFRRTIQIAARPYLRLSAYCERHDYARSELVEQMLEPILSGEVVLEPEELARLQAHEAARRLTPLGARAKWRARGGK